MVALDHRGLAKAGFDDVRIDRALHKIIDGADLLGFGLKHTDEFLADDLALRLRIGDAGELREEPILRIDADEVDIPFAEGGFDLVALILAHQAMVDKHAGELAADGLESTPPDSASSARPEPTFSRMARMAVWR